MNDNYCQHSGCNLICSLSSNEFCEQHSNQNTSLGNLQNLENINPIQQRSNVIHSAQKPLMYLSESAEAETVNDVNDLLEIDDVVDDNDDDDDDENDEDDNDSLNDAFNGFSNPHKRQEKAKWSEDEVCKLIIYKLFINYILN